MSPSLAPSTPPPSSPTHLPAADALPSASASSSLHSLRTALTSADDAARLLLFSPDRKSGASGMTAGTGATGSTEEQGAATRSLVGSVEGRGERGGGGGEGEGEGKEGDKPKPRTSDASSASLASLLSNSNESEASSAASWDHARSLLLLGPGSPRVEHMLVRMPVLEMEMDMEMPPQGLGLLTPEPEAEAEPFPTADQREYEQEQPEDEADDNEVRIKRESSSSDGEDLAPLAPPSRPLALTNSQEDALLSYSVTRSQSDFNRWLEETMRCARGDGTGSASVIESDDALSSILLATRTRARSQTGRQPSFGGLSFASASFTGSVLGARGADVDGAPLSPPESETGSLLDREGEGETTTEEEEEEEEEACEVEMVEFGAGGVKVEEEEEEDAGKVRQASVEGGDEKVKLEEEAVDTATDALPAAAAAAPKPPSPLRWKLLSLALSLALLWTLTRPAPLAPPFPELPELLIEEPTRALPRYIPINDSLVETSHFATPLSLDGGATFGLSGYAVLFTALAAVAASVPLVRRGRTAMQDCTDDDASSSSSSFSTAGATRPRSRASSPLASFNGSDLLLARSLLTAGLSAYSSRALSAAASHFSAILPLACGPALKSAASEWLGRALYRLARADLSEGEGGSERRMRDAVAAFERAVRLTPGRATPRASLGRARYRLGEWDRAVRDLRAAVKRDEGVAFAHEWLAKALVKKALAAGEGGGGGGRVTSGAAKEVEKHLLRAIELSSLSSSSSSSSSSPSSASASFSAAANSAPSHAFLGAFLLSHPSLPTPTFPTPSARLAAALTHLTRATALRPGAYPVAHALLARAYGCEALDPLEAAREWAAVCEARFAAGVERDEPLEELVEGAGGAVKGAAPWVRWAFATPRGSKERREVLRRAVREMDPLEDEVVGLLLGVEEALAGAEEVDDELKPAEGRKTRSTSATPSPSGAASNRAAALFALQERELALAAQCERFPLPSLSSSTSLSASPYLSTGVSAADLLPHGLHAVLLLALGEHERAEGVFGAFWAAVLAAASVGVDGQASAEERARWGWVARAFWEGKQARDLDAGAQTKDDEAVPVAVKKATPRRADPSSAPATTPATTRRTTRASSATPTPAPASASAKKGRGRRVEKVEEVREEEEEGEAEGDAGTVKGGKAVKEEVKQEEGQVKTPLRRSPRKVVKKEVESA
ncbi:hypothetical protein JCM6882_009170 [Rhodosporidiobolus microsporus]